jgi:hypothetical protein
MLEDLGNIGEFAGAIGVVASLLYLAWEVRRNTTIQLWTNHRLTQEELHASVRLAAESGELASVVVQAMEDLSSLNPGQRYQLDMYMMSWLQNAELAMLDQQLGLLSEATVQPYREAIAGHLRSPGGQDWWGERRSWFTVDGQRAFDEVLADAGISGRGAGVAPHHA